VVVFGDTNTSAFASAYLADIIRDNLAKQNVVIQVVRDIAAAATAAAYVSLSTHHFIKHQPSAGTPLFFPRVDECYYTPMTPTPTSYDILRDVSCIIDLWNSHEEMVLNVIKSGDDRDAENANDNDDDDESGTEGFDDDDDDDGDCRRRRPYQIDYAKIIEEYYHSKLSHTPRRLVIMF
jgi:hypothetical protein